MTKINYLDREIHYQFDNNSRLWYIEVDPCRPLEKYITIYRDRLHGTKPYDNTQDGMVGDHEDSWIDMEYNGT